MANLRQVGIRLALAALAVGLSAWSANARWGGGNIWLSCSNGQTYALSARAVAVDGDLVTGYLHLSPRRAVHMRLIPMGVGYRYAGRGIWLDGVRSEAVLHFGKNRSVDCSVSPVSAETWY